MIRLMSHGRGLAGALLLLLLSACGGKGYIPVQDLAISADKSGGSIVLHYKPKTPNVYTVKGGDTLFAIAWRYGWDYKALAKLNNIPAPYIIYVGQKIAFNATGTVPKKPAKTVAKTVSNKTTTTTNSANTTSAKPTVSSAKQVNKPVKPYQGSSSLRWQWPLQGGIVQKFVSQSETNKGVDIAAKPGSQVRAAAEGQIVYAGNGIQGYGNLLIIKHNDTYLSAYAYNSLLLVAEGDIVKLGQLIAQSGKGPQLDGRLHFEIRKDGRPVNPQSYLP